MKKNNILWIRNDLRFEDNTALIEAIETSYEENANLTLIFHINKEQIKIGTHSNDYFFSALNVFYEKLKSMGADLLFLYGEPEIAFNNFFKTNKNIFKVFFNISERGYGLERDKKVSEIFEKNNVEIYGFFDKHLHDVNQILNGEGKNYKVFTAYYKKSLSLSKAKILKFSKEKFKKVFNNKFSNNYKNEYNKILNSRKNNFEFICGEDIAFNELLEFIDNDLENYEDFRDDIFGDLNSKMSKYLSTGQISIRQIYHTVANQYSNGSKCYIKQLVWRDFYNMVYHYNPKQDNQEIISKYRFIKWNRDKYAFNIWKFGLTGYPLVDAAMRNLLETGEIHNRLRMIVASFLVKDLLIDWRMGEKYFKDMLIDYDSASNIGSWQWVASTGTDSVPYFRIFNPITQSKRFDKNGNYIKKILTELSNVETKYIHEPHKSKIKELDYPKQIVVHKEQREKVLNMYTSTDPYDHSTDMKNEFIKRYTLFELSKIKNKTKHQLFEFHSRNKYLYFTYSISQKDKLGFILSENRDYSDLYNDYRKALIEIFEEEPTIKKSINAYEHMYGYFKETLSISEREEYKKLLEDYRNGKIDDENLKEYFNRISDKYDVEYIKKQTLIIQF